MKNIITVSLILMVFTAILFFISTPSHYPNVKWIKDYPGANNRYVTFTPVLKINPNKILGPTIGADYAKLNYEDIDNDGIMEVIIATDISVDFGEFYTSEKHVLKSYKEPQNGLTKFKLLSSENN